ncbi:MAG: C25 family cysteine peptidase [Bacteroidetes bacterium]|nr:C25 family cysteine peptidase [Bacteroidota bacterium]
MSRIKVSEMPGENIISYQGFVDPSKPGEIAFPSFDVFVAIPANTKPIAELISEESQSVNAFPELNPSISIINSQTNYAKQIELRNYDLHNLLINKGFLWIENNYCMHLKLNLFQLTPDGNGINIINKFIIQLRFSSNLSETKSSPQKKMSPAIFNKTFALNNISRISAKLSDSGSWIDYNSEYVKIGTNKDAVYRIGYDDLIVSGVNLTSIDPRTFKIFLKGKEIPIYVNGEADGIFNGGDFIEFVGLRNMGGNYREVSSIGEPYKEYVNRYSDTTIYWLTWNGNSGLRANPLTYNANVASDTLKYYSEVIHVEKNNWFDFAMQDAVRREMPYWSENKTWNEGNLGVGSSNINFQLQDVFPNASVKVFAKLQDYASNINLNAHLLAISLNNASKQDSGYINKYQQRVLQGIYNSSLLNEGSNSLNLYSFTTQADPNVCILDWYEIEYPRYLKVVDDSLNFQFHFLNSNSLKNILLTNLNDNKKYLIWKFGNNYKKYGLMAVNGNILFADTVNYTDKFVLVDSAKTLKPKIFYKKTFVNLRNQNNSADYIAITNKKFISTTSDYAAFISNAYSIRTKVIDVDDIYDEFAYGFFNPESIKDFLIKTHTNWQSPVPNYVLLIGGATYDYLGNKTKFQGAPPVINYVPSFGAPVSDNWFVIWDTTGAYIPQMNIGRLPVTTNEELLWYLQKHQNYVSQKYSSWNKRYLFFSGGTGNDQSQIDVIKSVNDYIINNYVSPAPIGGNSAHFYKTINPTTNFGPYTTQQFQSAVDSGGVFIAYLGHSGTQTWDNSITDPRQLKNSVGRSPLITDFGCSTAKFAEPDVISFSQLFVDSPNGQAIAYIGNSSLGFTSTSYSFPKLFYKKILVDSVLTIGDAHRLAKIDLINNYGTSSPYTLFVLSNTLIGDPIVKLDVPVKPDLSLSAEHIKYTPNSITDSDDSVSISAKYFNFGRVQSDTFAVAITSSFNQSITFSRQLKRVVPLYVDSLIFSLPVKNKPGEHSLRIILDSNNKIDELLKSNNEINLDFFVFSSAIKMPEVYTIEGKLASPITLLNPVSNPLSKNFRLEISDNIKFSNPYTFDLNFDTLITKAVIPVSFLNKRIWMRNRLNNSNNYGNTVSFINGTSNNYSLSDSLSISTTRKTNVKQDHERLMLDSHTIYIRALSAGFNDGNTALIQINNQNLVPENTLRGQHVVVIEDSSYKFVGYHRFDLLGDPNATQNYINFLDTLSSKYLVAFAVSDEGSVDSNELKKILKLFGSKLIDELGWRGSWAMIGKKGSQPGSVPEAVSQAFGGRVQVDTTIMTRYSQGSFVTTKVGPASVWKSISISDSIPVDAAINYRLIGIKKNKNADTLNYFQAQNGVADISFVVTKLP